MEKNRPEADKQAKEHGVLSDKQEFGGEAEKKLKEMGERSSQAAEKASHSSDKK